MGGVTFPLVVLVDVVITRRRVNYGDADVDTIVDDLAHARLHCQPVVISSRRQQSVKADLYYTATKSPFIYCGHHFADRQLCSC